MNNELKHYGILRRSGRYPWGSGEQPFQSGGDWLSYVTSLRESGMTYNEIADHLGIKVGPLRGRITVYNDERKAAEVARAWQLKEKGLSNVAIGEKMGINESQVRAMLKPGYAERAAITENIAKVLRDAVENKKYVDVGLGTEQYLNISKEKLKAAIYKLEDEGYVIQYIKTPQPGTGKMTTQIVLTKGDVDYKEVSANRSQITPIYDVHFTDGGRNAIGMKPYTTFDSKRLDVVYGEKGKERDGLIELRRGVDEISLDGKRYAQVRISVDGTHYIKGMAMYSDDLPPGVDIRFNTGKPESLGKMGVLKPIKEEGSFPFGADVRQREYINSKGKSVVSPVTLVNEEGDWIDWNKTLSSQMVSKQSPDFAKKQLDKAYALNKAEYDEISSLTNPAIKQKLLIPFSNALDRGAVHLDAAGMPRQAWAVILPFTDMKENEIYAPNHNHGESVVLIRYPHGGIFEIPQLVVNNKHKQAKKLLGNAQDAVGINPKVAEKLSGADFDGDTVLVIPSSNTIKTKPSLIKLKGFDSKTAYPQYPGMPLLSEKNKQIEMGKISNLITDMSIFGASDDEIAAAVKHSMVVIDAVNHKLNYKQSEIDNGIAALNTKYRGKSTKGASTLLSKSESPEYVPHREDRLRIDPLTGKKIYVETGESYYTKEKVVTKVLPSGEIVSKVIPPKEIQRRTKSTKMAETDDAFTLSSGTRIETVYAEYANKMKALANQARKDYVEVVPNPISRSAKKVYKNEVDSLSDKLRTAILNKPYERMATVLANETIYKEKLMDPDMKPERLKNIKNRALSEARKKVGAKKYVIDITPKEWEAIQSGAISHTKVLNILDNADLDKVKAYATPRKEKPSISVARMGRARTMLNAGHTQSEVAAALGMSLTTLQEIING